MFWKIKSKEFLELRKLIDVLILDVELLNQRFRKKIKPLKKDDEKDSVETFDDGMNELRKLYNA